MIRTMMPVFAAIGSLLLCTTVNAATYGFTQGNGSISFHNKGSLHDFDGSAKAFTGTLDTTAGTGSMTIQASSLTTNFGPRDSKLHEFCLESTSYATMSFSVSSISGDTAGLQSGAGAGTITLNGTLTIRGIGKSVSVSTNYSFEEGALRLKGSHAMRWGDYGVPDPSISFPPVKLYPDMTVGFDVKLQQQ
jgi:polyisoprenoid-binding protein YceI